MARWGQAVGGATSQGPGRMSPQLSRDAGHSACVGLTLGLDGDLGLLQRVLDLQPNF